jgi:acyl transferase domain-containing protein
VLSAKTPRVLEEASAQLAAHLQAHPEQKLADVAYTLQVGRRAFFHRRAVLCRDGTEGRHALAGADPSRVLNGVTEGSPRGVAFLCPGQGAQYVGMCGDLYRQEQVFRDELDRCVEPLREELGLDLRELLFPREGEEQASARLLDQTRLTQPAVFAASWALARLWLSFGVTPRALLGHSVGEYVAACLSEVMALEDALRLVAARGRLMQSLPAGAMLAVPLGEGEASALLGDDLSLAAVNGPRQCVVSGPSAAVAELEARLQARGLEGQRLATSHAFHSRMMEPILGEFESLLRSVRLGAPRIPYISNLTGTWITPGQASDPCYWTKQLRSAVRFGDGVTELLGMGPLALLEVGPGQALAGLVRQHPACKEDHIVVSSTRRAPSDASAEQLGRALGQLWTSGVDVDWAGFHAGEERRRVPLPAYPFDRQRYFVEPGVAASSRPPLAKRPDPGSWFHLPAWKSAPSPRLVEGEPSGTAGRAWLLFADEPGAGVALGERLRREGDRVTLVRPGGRFEAWDGGFLIRPGVAEDYAAVLAALDRQDGVPPRLVHAWSAVPRDAAQQGPERFARAQERGLLSVLHLLQASRRRYGSASVDLIIVGSHLYEVSGGEPLCPERLPALALSRIAAQEQPGLTCRSVDVPLSDTGGLDARTLEGLVDECLGGVPGTVVALRNGKRWLQTFEAVALPRPSPERLRLRDGGVYLITGGLGEIGLEVAQRLARLPRAKLVLVGLTAPPPREQWEHWLREHGEEDGTSRRILKLRSLEALGAELLVRPVDVADREGMRAVVAEARDRFGRLHGVIHAAGMRRGRSFASVLELGRDECLEQFRSKVLGLYVLEEVVRGETLDFCILMSSLSAVLGGLGMGAYAAANLFMDGFASLQNQAGHGQWTSVGWDGWRLEDDGMDPAAESAKALALTRAEGLEALERLLGARGVPQIAVSTGDLGARLDRWVMRPATLASESGAVTSAAPAGHRRPELATACVAPRNAMERAIVELWESLLGIHPVGVDDDFFELGGHSLLATQLSTRLRETFGVEIPLRALFEAPTVAALASHVAASAPRQGSAERAAAVLQRLREMSPEDKRKLLEQEKREREEAR